MAKAGLWSMLVIGCLAAASMPAVGDDDDGGGWLSHLWYKARIDVAPVDNELYREECGSCHFAYQPGLLPGRSWSGIMSQLDNHFGENAELDAPTANEITRYLTANAADRSDYPRSRGFAASATRGTSVLRITETRYFRRKHHEIPSWVMNQGTGELRFSQCDTCHTLARRGVFDEHSVRIPGLGRWDD